MVLAPGIGPFGPWELLLILAIVVIVFGVGRLPEIGGALGKSMREFRKSTKDDTDDEASPGDSPPSANAATTASSGTMPVSTAAAPPDAATEPADSVYCTNCGTENARTAKFCSKCGQSVGAAVG